MTIDGLTRDFFQLTASNRTEAAKNRFLPCVDCVLSSSHAARSECYQGMSQCEKHSLPRSDRIHFQIIEFFGMSHTGVQMTFVLWIAVNPTFSKRFLSSLTDVKFFSGWNHHIISSDGNFLYHLWEVFTLLIIRVKLKVSRTWLIMSRGCGRCSSHSNISSLSLGTNRFMSTQTENT